VYNSVDNVENRVKLAFLRAFPRQTMRLKPVPQMVDRLYVYARLFASRTRVAARHIDQGTNTNKGSVTVIIDFHTHAFPDPIAPRAISSLCECAGGIQPLTDGTTASLCAVLGQHGIDRAVILNIATNETQHTAVNNFASNIHDEMLVPFGSVHPFAENALDELRRIASLGLKGIKLHPDYQKFYADDERIFPFYAQAASLGLITVFHAGVDIGLFEPVYCTPERLARALPAFGGGIVVAAHFGGYLLWNDVEQHLVGRNIYFDTSYCAGRMPVLQARRIVASHGASRILFGTDLPWGDPGAELRFARSLGLAVEEEALVLGGNAARLLGMA